MIDVIVLGGGIVGASAALMLAHKVSVWRWWNGTSAARTPVA